MTDFHFTTDEDTHVWSFSGRLGTENIEIMNHAVQNKIEEYKNSQEKSHDLKICFDLKNVTYIASSFVRLCISTSKQVSEDHFVIKNASPVIKKTFMIAGLDKMLHVK